MIAVNFITMAIETRLPDTFWIALNCNTHIEMTHAIRFIELDAWFNRRATATALAPESVFSSALDAYRLAQRLGDELLELDQIGIEAADAVGQLFGGHGVFVEHPAERLLVEMHALELLGAGGLDRELAGERSLCALQLAEQLGRDRQAGRSRPAR